MVSDWELASGGKGGCAVQLTGEPIDELEELPGEDRASLVNIPSVHRSVVVLLNDITSVVEWA